MLLAALDNAADRAISTALEAIGDELTEPAVARIISQNLPPGVLRPPPSLQNVTNITKNFPTSEIIHCP